MPKAPAADVVLEEVEIRSSWNYRDGRSDKDYLIALERSGDGWAVNVAYGRRGSTLTPGCKTGSSPVPYPKAHAVYEKQVKERLSKGYVCQDTPGQAYVAAPADKVHSGVSCQLLNPVEESDLDALLDDPFWGAQLKHNGRRLMVRKTGEGAEAKVEGINRKGILVGFPKAIEVALRQVPGDFIIDGEAVGDTLQAFDLLQQTDLYGQGDVKALPYDQRWTMLNTGLGKDSLSGSDAVKVVPLARTPDEKRALLAYARENELEGVVFKRLDAPYVAGRPNSGGNQLKFKLYYTCSVIVEAENLKRSVSLSMLDETGARVSVGNVTIPPNYPVPKAGDVVEVRYMHAFRGGSIYQPTYLGARDDIDAKDCLLKQLVFKPEEALEDDLAPAPSM